MKEFVVLLFLRWVFAGLLTAMCTPCVHTRASSWSHHLHSYLQIQTPSNFPPSQSELLNTLDNLRENPQVARRLRSLSTRRLTQARLHRATDSATGSRTLTPWDAPLRWYIWFDVCGFTCSWISILWFAGAWHRPRHNWLCPRPHHHRDELSHWQPNSLGQSHKSIIGHSQF